ncbi:MAG TPA: DUF4340 domain-containing protein [Candidatus Methylomirabilis sp.]|nr:DUF4340 domain-containing protein [Candidatus Methylomirabilis sp.]
MSKKNIILSIILIVLVLFAWLWSGPFANWQISRSEEKNFLSGISPDLISKIEIDNGGATTTLEKFGALWKVGGTKDFYVNKDLAAALNTFLGEIGKKKLEVAGTSDAQKSSFATDGQGVKVKIEQPGRKFDFIVGKNTPDFLGSYFSPLSGGKTYRVDLDLSGIFDRTEWRDNVIFSFAADQANKIRFQYPDRQFTVEKKDNKWSGTLPKAFSVNADKVSAVLGELDNLTAAKIPAQTFAGTGLEKHRIIVEITGQDFDNTLMIGDCTKDNYCYAKRGDSDNIYLIAKAVRDALDKNISSLQ